MIAGPELSGSRVQLRDDSFVFLRRGVSEDRDIIRRFSNGLSDETVFFRFFESMVDRELILQRLLPRNDDFVLLAIKDGIVVGHAGYYKSGKDTAEVGVLILEGFQGLGLGTLMIERIASMANRDGISVFEAVISWDNTRMIRMVKSMGFPTSVKVEPDLIRIRFPTSIDPVSIDEFQSRWMWNPLLGGDQSGVPQSCDQRSERARHPVT